jgi:hypothetical protein
MANENNGTSPKIWLMFLGVLALVAICYPPILGFFFGLIIWLVPVAAIWYFIGHKGKVL